MIGDVCIYLIHSLQLWETLTGTSAALTLQMRILLCSEIGKDLRFLFYFIFSNCLLSIQSKSLYVCSGKILKVLHLPSSKGAMYHDRGYHSFLLKLLLHKGEN